MILVYIRSKAHLPLILYTPSSFFTRILLLLGPPRVRSLKLETMFAPNICQYFLHFGGSYNAVVIPISLGLCEISLEE